MELSGLEILNSLKNTHWIVATNTYGNSHATFIGLLVSWWIASDPQTRWALESGPSFGHRPKGLGGGMCDAILGEGRNAIGLLEVEGLRGKSTAEKIGKFFKAEYDELKTLKFAILMLYAYGPIGRGLNRTILPARQLTTFQEIARVYTMYTEKSIIVITLDKTYERQQEGIRKRNEYYWGRPSLIQGFLYEAGKETATCTF